MDPNGVVESPHITQTSQQDLFPSTAICEMRLWRLPNQARQTGHLEIGEKRAGDFTQKKTVEKNSSWLMDIK